MQKDKLMTSIGAVRGSLIAAMLAASAAGSALAQVSPVVFTDAGAMPAEERDSMGAVLMEDSPVRAQRQTFGQRNTAREVQAIGQGVMRATLAAARAQEEGPNTRALGGPPEPGERIAPVRPK